MTNAANAVLEAVGKCLASLGTVWVNIGTPNLTGGGSSGGRAPGASAPNSAGLEVLLGYAMWISFGIAVLSLIAIGVRMASLRHQDAAAHVDRLMIVLGGVLLVSSASGIVAAVLPRVQSQASPAVAYVQNSLWWYMAAAVVLSVIIGGARMAWEQRAEPGRDLLRSLFTLIVVSGAGLTAIALLTAAADSFSVWLINGSLKCDVTNTGDTCFGGNMAALLTLTSAPPGSVGLGVILIIVLGLTATLTALMQIVLMVARAGMLVILAGVLPLSAAATNTEMGRTWFKRAVAWLVAFILYKPAAAIVYATAFKLAGTNVFRDDGTGLISVLVGVMVMLLALLALPALMRFVTPLVVSLASGGSGGGSMALGAAAMLPTGAVQGAGHLVNGSSAAGPAPMDSSPARGAGPGGAGAPGGAGNAGPAGGASQPGGSGPTGVPPGAGEGGPMSGAGPGGRSVSGAGAPGAESAGGGSASGGGAGAATGAGAGTAAAGGPVGIAVAAGAAAAQRAQAAGQSVAAAVAEGVRGEEGPSGSR